MSKAVPTFSMQIVAKRKPFQFNTLQTPQKPKTQEDRRIDDFYGESDDTTVAPVSIAKVDPPKGFAMTMSANGSACDTL